MNSCKKLGIDIGSTTVKVSIIEDGGKLLFADYKRHFANIQETLADLLREGEEKPESIQLLQVSNVSPWSR